MMVITLLCFVYASLVSVSLHLVFTNASYILATMILMMTISFDRHDCSLLAAMNLMGLKGEGHCWQPWPVWYRLRQYP